MESSSSLHGVDTSIDDGLPSLIPLCDLQSAVASAYAEVLSFVTKQLAESSGSRTDGLDVVLERLRYDASWAATEVRRGVDFKIRRQRYISHDVYSRWRELQRSGDKRVGPLAEDSAGKTLCHEHVVERRKLGAAIKNFDKADDIYKVLSKAVACVVSRAEDKRLREVSNVDGWERYRRADPPVGVYDRLKRLWVVERS